MSDRLAQSVSNVAIHRLQAGQRSEAEDLVVVEEPMEIRIGKVSVAVTMRTPGYDDELTAGFLYTEGVITDSDDLVSVEHCCETDVESDAKNIIVIELRPDHGFDLDRLRRNFYATSSCGICGKASIEQVCGRVEPVESDMRVSDALLTSMPDALRDAQRVFGETGGLHAAGIFTPDGKLLCVREDVGRHNAVDKVIGWAALEGRLPLDRHVLMVSGRASFEIVQKALVARIPIVAAVSAPSSLAVDLAEQSGMTLVGFLRDASMNVYTGAQRIES